MQLWPKKKWKQALIVAAIVIAIAIPTTAGYLSCVNREPTPKNGGLSGALAVSSSAFENGAAIPSKYTAQGANLSPPLNFTGIPEGTQSLVVTVNDPMFPPLLTWNHWVNWNIPPMINMTEGISAGVQGRNGWNRNSYGGPDPVGGVHTYVFTVYALDCMLSLQGDARQSEVFRAMDGHVLDSAQLTGTYAK